MAVAAIWGKEPRRTPGTLVWMVYELPWLMQNPVSLCPVSYTHLLLEFALTCNPDIVCVGEMKSAEAFAAQEAARTGHAVITKMCIRDRGKNSFFNPLWGPW